MHVTCMSGACICLKLSHVYSMNVACPMISLHIPSVTLHAACWRHIQCNWTSAVKYVLPALHDSSVWADLASVPLRLQMQERSLCHHLTWWCNTWRDWALQREEQLYISLLEMIPFNESQYSFFAHSCSSVGRRFIWVFLEINETRKI